MNYGASLNKIFKTGVLSPMTVLKGNGVFKGIAFGKLKMYTRDYSNIKKYKVSDVESEIKRYEDAKRKSIENLKRLYESSREEIGEESAMIFQIHQMMLEDMDYCESILNIIENQGINAEYAVWVTSESFQDMFLSMEDSYMKERAADVKDVSHRLIECLLNPENEKSSDLCECIIGADDLAPSETVQLDRDKIKGFVTMYGSTSSHTAILARTMNIPAVIGLGDQLKPEFDGCSIIVDGFSGTVYINPDITTINRLKKKKELCDHQNELLKNLKGKENVSLDGQKIDVYANIGSLADIDMAIQNDAGGIGLFRSEFLYLRRKDYPTEEEQFNAYKKAAEKMEGKRVIIRTLDVGADKKADYFKIPKEENPAMGYRAVRICLDRPEIFKTQLRAIFRASAYGKISVMFPMIISTEEVKKIKSIVEEVKKELSIDGIRYSDDVELGIMIETPGAALISDELAKEVDFFSIGTNDLTQYTLAIDRQNNKISKMYDPHHKSVIRMIKMVADNAHKNGIWVGICGELAADESLVETFMSIGIDELSMSSPFILGIREKIRGADIGKVREKIIEDLS